MEEGLPLTEAERERMPDADTVWLTPLPEMLDCLERVGLVVRWQDDCSRSHRAVADSLIDAFAADAADIAAQIGRRALEELLAAHRLWSDWLREGRVRKIAFVAEKTETARRLARASAGAGIRHRVRAGTRARSHTGRIGYTSRRAPGNAIEDHTMSQIDSTRERLIETYRKKAKHYDDHLPALPRARLSPAGPAPPGRTSTRASPG